MGMVFGRKEKMVKNMRDNLLKIEDKDMEYILGQMAISTKVIIRQIFDMEVDKCFGLMVRFIRVIG